MNDALLLLEQALSKVIYPKYYNQNTYALATNMSFVWLVYFDAKNKLYF